jgi:hypothetical protein
MKCKCREVEKRDRNQLRCKETSGEQERVERKKSPRKRKN